MKNGWQCVYYSDKMHRVEIVKAVLEDNQIQSIVMDKRDSSYISIGDIDVLVRNEDAVLARLIIEQNNL